MREAHIFILIIGKNERLVIDVPDKCTVKIEKLPHPVTPHNRVSIMKSGKQGSIRINMNMESL